MKVYSRYIARGLAFAITSWLAFPWTKNTNQYSRAGIEPEIVNSQLPTETAFRSSEEKATAKEVITTSDRSP